MYECILYLRPDRYTGSEQTAVRVRSKRQEERNSTCCSVVPQLRGLDSQTIVDTMVEQRVLAAPVVASASSTTTTINTEYYRHTVCDGVYHTPLCFLCSISPHQLR